MNDGKFSFGLPSRIAAEHILSREWMCKKMKLNLVWWKPTTGCRPAEVRSQNMFKKIGDQSGGFIEMEEETSLKNHLHWAHIRVKGDGTMVLREIDVTSEGFVYTLPIGCEILETVKGKEEIREEKGFVPVDNKG